MSNRIPDLYEIIDNYRSNYFGELVIEIVQHGKRLSAKESEELEFIRKGSSDSLKCITWGIQALGEQLANAANNEEAGLDSSSIADIGYLFKFLGEMEEVAQDLGSDAAYCLAEDKKGGQS